MTQRSGTSASIGLLAAAALFAAAPAWAQATDGHAHAVDPTLNLDPRASCATLNADNATYPTITSNFGFKIDGDPGNGTYYFTSANGVLTGGAPSDPANYIHISGAEGTQYFNWAASLGIDAVIVKAQDSNVFIYTPEAFADQQLHAPELKDISHVEFCYDYSLSVSKTAAAGYPVVVSWNLTKAPNGTYAGFPGDTFTHAYTVTATRNETIGTVTASGTITISNSTPLSASITAVNDVITNPDGANPIAAAVDCGSVLPIALDAGATLPCTYTATLPDAAARVNTVTVETAGSVGGGSFNVSFTPQAAFSGDQSISLADDNPGSNVTGTTDGTKTFSYSREFSCPTDAALYAGDGIHSYTNVNTATATGTSTNLSANASVQVTCYAPVVSKTALADWQKTIAWTIGKTVTPNTASKFVGESQNYEYTVTVNRTDVDVYKVTGTISVQNPRPDAAMTLTSVTDTIQSGAAANVTCPSLTVPASGTLTCTYEATLDANTDGTNVATAVFGGLSVIGAQAYTFGAPVITGHESINVTDTNGEAWTTGADASWTYTETRTCSGSPSDYVGDGFLTTSFDNTATITETKASDSETVVLNCYAPVVTKTAQTEWKKKYDWSITKAASPDSLSGFVGAAFNADYDVVVDQTITDYGFKAFGAISVANPAGAPGDMIVNITDGAMGAPETASLECGGSLTVSPGTTGTCNYTLPLPDTSNRVNTASVLFNSITFTAEANVAFGDPVIEGNPIVHVIDTEKGALGAASSDTTFKYTRSFACSSNPAQYAGDGIVSTDYPNTATITETSQTASEIVTVTCYAPVITKDGAATYTNTHTWSITKAVTPASQNGYPGDELVWTWTVTVDETSVEGAFAVTGMINVTNPANQPMTVMLADALSDGTPASIGCTGDSNLADGLTIAAGSTAVCEYVASPSSKTATSNTATATLNGVGFTATALFAFVEAPVNGTAIVDDPQMLLSEVLTAGGGPWTFTYDANHVCSGGFDAYGDDGTYGEGLENTATLTGSDGQVASASATATYTCDAGFLRLRKLTDGVANPTMQWMFKLFEGPDGFGGTQVGSTSKTSDDGVVDGVLTFGTPALDPTKTYTLCEVSVPAGWTSFWQVDTDNDGFADATVIPYNPDADNVPPEDLGNRCVDVGFGTEMPIVVHSTLTFQVDNTYPGGDPRTPGYWKNWNRCTGGGQALNADRQGGYANGYWLLEDVLNPLVGGGIVWDDLLSDSVSVNITSCEGAVEILDQRVVTLNGLVGDGKKLSSDAARTLARHLLAAQLNAGAGACQPIGAIADGMTLGDIMIAAETLLDGLNFDGTKATAYLTSKSANYAYALALAKALDQYNNGMFCGSTYVP